MERWLLIFIDGTPIPFVIRNNERSSVVLDAISGYYRIAVKIAITARFIDLPRPLFFVLGVENDIVIAEFYDNEDIE